MPFACMGGHQCVNREVHPTAVGVRPAGVLLQVGISHVGGCNEARGAGGRLLQEPH